MGISFLGGKEMRPQDLFYLDAHNHTEFSNTNGFLDSTIKVKELILRAYELGYKGIAITDHANISAHVQAIQITKDLKKSGKISEDFKVVLGVEAYVVNEQEMTNNISKNKPNRFYHMVILATNEKGHEAIHKISTQSFLQSFTHRGVLRTPIFYHQLSELMKNFQKGDLIITTACLGGFMGQVVSNLINTSLEEEQQQYKKDIYQFVCWALDTFGEDNVFFELQPSLMEEQVAYNQMLVKIANAYQIPYVVATDTHYLNKEDREVHEAFLTSDSGDTDRELGDFYDSTYLHSFEEFYEKMGYLGEEVITNAINNTKLIYDKCKEYDLYKNQVIPKIPLPPKNEWGTYEELYQMAKGYKSIQAMIDSPEPYDNYLINLAFKGMIDKGIPKEKYKEKLARIDIECYELIGISKAKGQPISSYFITMAKCVDLIWESGSIIGPSRGSCAGFELNYVLGISQVSPLEQGIEMPHWRFISAERPDYPDIDIDIPSHMRQKVFDVLTHYFGEIGGSIIRVATFGTETAKSAIRTAGRGLGINSDVLNHLSSLIPVHRGKVQDLLTTYQGNDEVEPVAEFKRICDDYSAQGIDLIGTALRIEGLVNKRSSHACGALICNDDFTKYNSIMTAPSGEYTTAFNLSESEYTGLIKYDFLNTKIESIIQVAMMLLIEAGHMEWQGTLRKTYDKYLHPDVLDETTEEMWDKFKNGELIGAFQFETIQGENSVNLIKPSSLIETAAANTLMRLMVEEEGAEQPIQMYVRYKNNIQEWYDDMVEFGLNEEEIKILEEYLLQDYGVANTQETMMMLSMDHRISNFSVVESNALRKSVAKKVGKLYEQSHQLFYEKGLANGCRKVFLDYIWNVQIALQRGYSFSILHSVGYSKILIQQLNLIHHYPPIYYNTALLEVESGALEQEAFDEEDNDGKKKKEKQTNYGAMASAVSTLQKRGVKIDTPDVNRAKVGFVPDEKSNSIVFAMKGISKINNETAKAIMEHRPYTSFDDFKQRMVEEKHEVLQANGQTQMKSYISNSQLIMLIKAGAFEGIDPRSREELMETHLRSTFKPKSQINAKLVQQVLEMGLIPLMFQEQLKHYNFREFLKKLPKENDKTSKSIKWHTFNTGDASFDDYATNYFATHFELDLIEGRDYRYNEAGQLQVAMGTKRKGSFEDIHAKTIEPLMTWLKSGDCLDHLNRILWEEHWNKHAKGTKETWEMESMCLYYDKHELDVVNLSNHGIVSFDDLAEEPTIVGYNKYGEVSYPKYATSLIAGTVLDKNATKHTITLLTPTGVVNVKYQAGQYSHYSKTLSVTDENTGNKTVVEDSWFKKGTLVIINGYRSHKVFRAKAYKDSMFKHTTMKITEVLSTGELRIQEERRRLD